MPFRRVDQDVSVPSLSGIDVSARLRTCGPCLAGTLPVTREEQAAVEAKRRPLVHRVLDRRPDPAVPFPLVQLHLPEGDLGLSAEELLHVDGESDRKIVRRPELPVGREAERLAFRPGNEVSSRGPDFRQVKEQVLVSDGILANEGPCCRDSPPAR